MVFSIFSFSLHHTNPAACWGITLVLFLVSAGVFACLIQLARVRSERDEHHAEPPTWYGFLFVTCVLMIFAGIIFGYINFDRRTSNTYTYESLATYRDIDPALFVGQQLVDAGRVTFHDKTHLDITKSMGFKDSDVYCVAPIVSPNTTSKTYYDFWAVGKNCCTGTAADFHCEGYNNPQAGGLRLMDEAARPFYRLAVQQAEATHKISTHKPLFFVWGQDPIKWTEGLKHDAVSTYMAGIIAALCLQCFLVATATLAFMIFTVTDADGSVPKNVAPFLIGATITTMITVFGPLTGAGMNPARDIGPRLVTFFAGWGSVALTSCWIYTVGPITGAVLGGYLYNTFFKELNRQPN